MKLHHDRMALWNRLQAALQDAITQPRDFTAELHAVLDAANLWALGHPDTCSTITMAEVERCDLHAAGHIDWSTKLPLYVSEAVYGLRWNRETPA